MYHSDQVQERRREWQSKEERFVAHHFQSAIYNKTLITHQLIFEVPIFSGFKKKSRGKILFKEKSRGEFVVCFKKKNEEGKCLCVLRKKQRKSICVLIKKSKKANNFCVLREKKANRK